MTTRHYISRANERGRYNESEAIRLEKRAQERGKFAEDMPRREKDYMEYKNNNGVCSTVFYSGYFFIYCKDKCVTMYEAPKWFCKREYYHGKEKIRDVKKYMRYSLEENLDINDNWFLEGIATSRTTCNHRKNLASEFFSHEACLCQTT